MICLDSDRLVSWAGSISALKESTYYDNCSLQLRSSRINEALDHLADMLKDTAAQIEQLEEALIASYGQTSFADIDPAVPAAELLPVPLNDLDKDTADSLMQGSWKKTGSYSNNWKEYSAGIGEGSNKAYSKNELLAFSVTGEAEACLFDEKGNFLPALSLKEEAELSVFKSSNGFDVGNEYVNLHGNAQGKFLTLEEKLTVKAGKDGIRAEAIAGASLFKGTGSLDFSLFGFTASLSLSAIVGAEASANLTVQPPEFSIGCSQSLGIGYGINFSIKPNKTNLYSKKEEKKVWENHSSYQGSW